MNIRHVVVPALLTFALHAAGQGTRQVSLAITCHAPGGAVKSDVPLAGTTLVGSWSALTDASGRANASVAVRADEKTLRIRIGPKHVADGEQPDLDGYLKASEIKLESFVPDEWLVALLPGVSDYAVNVDLGFIRKVAFHLVDQNGVGQDCVVRGPGDVHEERPVIGGMVQVLGVPTTLCNLAALCGQQLVDLSVPPGDGDVDLGNVVVPSRTCDAAVTIRLISVEQIDRRGNEIAELPVLVSADGGSLYQLWAAHNVTAADPGAKVPAQVPSGAYWVSPFPWTSTGTTEALIRLVRSGVDLAGSGIPKIVVVAGDHVVLEIDAAAAQRAILQTAAAHGLWPEY